MMAVLGGPADVERDLPWRQALSNESGGFRRQRSIPSRLISRISGVRSL